MTTVPLNTPFQGADVIECDVGVTADKQLVCVHDAWLSSNTNVKSVDQFTEKRKELVIEGRKRNDWWVSDFTMAELNELKLGTGVVSLH